MFANPVRSSRHALAVLAASSCSRSAERSIVPPGGANGTPTPSLRVGSPRHDEGSVEEVSPHARRFLGEREGLVLTTRSRVRREVSPLHHGGETQAVHDEGGRRCSLSQGQAMD